MMMTSDIPTDMLLCFKAVDDGSVRCLEGSFPTEPLSNLLLNLGLRDQIGVGKLRKELMLTEQESSVVRGRGLCH